MERKTKILFLDDSRKPDYILGSVVEREDIELVTAKSYSEFVSIIEEHDADFDVICFDHDLGDKSENEKNGKHCANFLEEYCHFNCKHVPDFFVHSSNPSASKIEQKLSKYANNISPKELVK